MTVRWLSYIINQDTPLYGGRTQNFNLYKTSSMKEGKVANDTRIESTVHIGTHIDMPYHFYEEGQTIEAFDANFWFFNRPLFIEIKPNGYIIEDELRKVLQTITDQDYDILLIKTGLCHHRDEKRYWQENYGFSPSLYTDIRQQFPSVRVMGFDSISVSSWQDRPLGKLAHQAFLNPDAPILLLEDMDLRFIDQNDTINGITVMPLRIEQCDGLPCTVIAHIEEDSHGK